MKVVAKVTLETRILDAVHEIRVDNRQVDYIELTKEENMELHNKANYQAGYSERPYATFGGYRIKVV